jgi:hypothetical protein
MNPAEFHNLLAETQPQLQWALVIVSDDLQVLNGPCCLRIVVCSNYIFLHTLHGSLPVQVERRQLLRHHCQGEIIAVATFVIHPVSVAVIGEGRAVGKVTEGARDW